MSYGTALAILCLGDFDGVMCLNEFLIQRGHISPEFPWEGVCSCFFLTHAIPCSRQSSSMTPPTFGLGPLALTLPAKSPHFTFFFPSGDKDSPQSSLALSSDLPPGLILGSLLDLPCTTERNNISFPGIWWFS